jgi:hypothetical protein
VLEVVGRAQNRAESNIEVRGRGGQRLGVVTERGSEPVRIVEAQAFADSEGTERVDHRR